MKWKRKREMAKVSLFLYCHSHLWYFRIINESIEDCDFISGIDKRNAKKRKTCMLD